ncbi:unnamed protein product [Boreogadus saida]
MARHSTAGAVSTLAERERDFHRRHRRGPRLNAPPFSEREAGRDATAGTSRCPLKEPCDAVELYVRRRDEGMALHDALGQ